MNSYEKAGWILQVAGLRQSIFQWPSSLNYNQSDLVKLALLLGVRVGQLEGLIYQIAADKRHVAIFGQTFRPYLIRPWRSRVCVDCLRESNYCRKQWEFVFVTTCPIHNTKLLERCHSCGTRLSWMRTGTSLCRCGADFRESPTLPLPNAQTCVSRLVYEKCGLMKGRSHQARNNPLNDLELGPIFEGLLFIAGQLESRNIRQRHTFPRKETATLHQDLLTAYSVFNDWPKNFHHLLDQIQSRNGSGDTNRKHSLQKDFRGLYKELCAPRSLSIPIASLLMTGFQDYVSKRWTLGYRPKRFQLPEKYVGLTDASRTLQIANETTEYLILNGKLKAVIKSRAKRNRTFLIDAASVAKLRREFEKYFSIDRASQFLGLSQTHVLKLIDQSVLIPVRRYSGAHDLRLDKSALKRFVAQLTSKIKTDRALRKDELQSFRSLVNLVTNKMAGSNYGIVKVIRDILSGLLVPRKKCETTVGVSSLRFSRKEVRQYLQKILRRQEANPTILANISTEGLNRKVILFLYRKRLIKTSTRRDETGAYAAITTDDLRLFNSRFMFATEVARKLGTRTERVCQALRSAGILPISGPAIDDGPQYVFRRAEVDVVDLHKLMTPFLLRRKRERKRTLDVTVAGVAEILSVSRKTVFDLVKNEVLRPYPRYCRLAPNLMFNRAYVLRLNQQFPNLSELMSTSAAARRLDTEVGNFHVRWLRRGYVRYQRSKDGKRRFVLKSDVEKIAIFKESVVTSEGAARMLGIPRHCVITLIRKQVLKPIANPYQPAFRGRVFSKAEVSKLCITRRKVNVAHAMFVSAKVE